MVRKSLKGILERIYLKDGWLSPEHIARMERGEGCVQCGEPATGTHRGYGVCGDPTCKVQINLIRASQRLAERLRKRTSNLDIPPL
jgi:hypothetical protein